MSEILLNLVVGAVCALLGIWFLAGVVAGFVSPNRRSPAREWLTFAILTAPVWVVFAIVLYLVGDRVRSAL